MAFSFSIFRSDQWLKSLHTEGELGVTLQMLQWRAMTMTVSPGEVNGGVIVVFWMEAVAMGESAEKGVGEQAGNLNLWQSNGCSVSSLKQWDALKTKTVTVTAAWLWAGGAGRFVYLHHVGGQLQSQRCDLLKELTHVDFLIHATLKRVTSSVRCF